MIGPSSTELVPYLSSGLPTCPPPAACTAFVQRRQRVGAVLVKPAGHVKAPVTAALRGVAVSIPNRVHEHYRVGRVCDTGQVRSTGDERPTTRAVRAHNAEILGVVTVVVLDRQVEFGLQLLIGRLKGVRIDEVNSQALFSASRTFGSAQMSMFFM